MAKLSIPSARTASFKDPIPLTSPSGLVQRGSYMTRQIDYKSRPNFTPPSEPSGLFKKR